MSARQDLINYFVDLAKRNVAINHTTAARRMWLETEAQTMVGTGIVSPDNKDWNMVFGGYVTRGTDNAHGFQCTVAKVVFQVLKHAPKDAAVSALNVLYNDAHALGKAIINQIDAHTKGHCAAVLSTGVKPPYKIDLNTVQAMEIGPRWDGFYGYEFALNIWQQNDAQEDVVSGEWQLLPGDVGYVAP